MSWVELLYLPRMKTMTSVEIVPASVCVGYVNKSADLRDWAGCWKDPWRPGPQNMEPGRLAIDPRPRPRWRILLSAWLEA